MRLNKLKVRLETLVLKAVRDDRSEGDIVGGDINRCGWCVWSDGHSVRRDVGEQRIHH